VLSGLVEYSDKQAIPDVCIFKRFDIAREITYKPGDIKIFGYRNGNRFESRELDKAVVFLEVIESGKIVLLQKGSRYFIDKDHKGLTELRNGSIIYNTGTGLQSYKNLKEFLVFITEGKTGALPEKFNLKYDLIPLITDYNKVSGESYNVFNRSFTEKELTRQVFVSGAARNRFGITGGVSLYSHTMHFRWYNVTEQLYAPSSGKDMAPVLGLTYERQLFRRTDRFSARIDLLFMQHSFYSYSERDNVYGGITRDDAWYKLTGLKLPVMIQYSLTGNRIVPYAGLGAAGQYFLSTSYRHIAEMETIAHVVNTTEDQDMIFKKWELTGVACVGARIRMVGKTNLGLTYMFDTGKGFFLNTNYYKDYSRKDDPFNINAIQHSVVMSLTF
jgi:hypothetical protein